MDHHDDAGFDFHLPYSTPPPPNRPRRTLTASPLTPAADPEVLNNPLPSFGPAERDSIFTRDNPSHLRDAYRHQPFHSFQSYLDTILNPAGLDHSRYSPFVYRNTPPHTVFGDMPPTTRARPARTPSGYVDHVDLTSTPDSPPQRRRQSPTPGPSAKRRKRENGSSHDAKVEEVDLSDEKPTVHEMLQKQRQDAVKPQTKPEEKPTSFNTITCVICMDNPTNLTATACGHVFCHECLMQALIAGENRTGHGEPRRSQCPVCRKSINRLKPSDIIPLLLKKGLATQPRKRKMASPTVVVPKVQ